MSVEQILMIESKWYTGQDANNLTINFDEELRNVESIKILYARIPCMSHKKYATITLKFMMGMLPNILIFQTDTII
jgi:hypothetical protein